MQGFNEFKSDFQIVGSLNNESQDEQLQRTEQWFKDRAGHYTGSRFKDLMKCGRSGSRLVWGSVEKLVDFGAGAEKYIFQVGKERETGLLNMEIKAKPLIWGEENEEKLVQQLLDDGVISDFEQLGFEKFSGYENAGASVDGVCTFKGERVGLEMKCCVSWDGFFKRMYDKVDENHDDFWQCQAEMMATGLKKVLFVSAMPMTVEKYEFQLVEASPIHQTAMLQRCKIGDEAIAMWKNHTYREALEIACANFKLNK